MLEKDQAILLRRTPYSNSSLIVSMLTRQHGVRELIAKGARRPKSPLLGQLDWFGEGELVWYPGRNEGLDTLAQFDPSTIRLAVRTHPDRFAAAAFCCELVAATVHPHHPEEETFALLAAALRFFDDGGSAQKGGIVFALQYLQHHGLSPALDECAECGAALHAQDGVYVAFARGFCVCCECARHQRSDVIPPAALESLRYFSRVSFEKAERLAMQPKALLGAFSTVTRMLESQFGRAFRSARFLLHHAERQAHASSRMKPPVRGMADAS